MTEKFKPEKYKDEYNKKIQDAIKKKIAGKKIVTSKNKDMPNWDVVEFDPLLDSANVAVEQWVNIGREIRDRYNNYDGFVVLHGTDTMSYTASALSFMLDGLNKPVVFTGSQIPLCELRSDGRDNLIN